LHEGDRVTGSGRQREEETPILDFRPPAAVPPVLASGAVALWAVVLDAPPEVVQRIRRVLSAGEEARAASFRFDLHRMRFIVARAALRSILGGYLRVAPRELELVYGPRGKPALSRSPSLHFNLSHSEGLALVAATRVGRIGVDLERIRPLDDLEGLARTFFSPGEQARFRALPDRSKLPALIACWTQKEAFLKALGEGVALPFESLDLWLAPGEALRTLSFREESGRSSTWSLRELRPASGYAGALALEGRVDELQCWRWMVG
jgi:4'-phosphopantetheinyl transferase